MVHVNLHLNSQPKPLLEIAVPASEYAVTLLPREQRLSRENKDMIAPGGLSTVCCIIPSEYYSTLNLKGRTFDQVNVGNFQLPNNPIHTHNGLVSAAFFSYESIVLRRKLILSWPEDGLRTTLLHLADLGAGSLEITLCLTFKFSPPFPARTEFLDVVRHNTGRLNMYLCAPHAAVIAGDTFLIKCKILSLTELLGDYQSAENLT